MLKFTSGPNAARSTAWLDAEEAASSAYTIDKTLYQNWMANRTNRIVTEITSANYTAPFNVTTAGGTTAAATINISGTAPSSVFTIVVDGHPEAVLTWTNQQQWTLSGIVLATGVNSFIVRGLDQFGNTIQTDDYTITKTGNALPQMRLESDPTSMNVALGEVLTLDAGTSFDPDNGALSFAWSNTPTSGVAVTHPTPSTTAAIFSVPGIYSFTATGTDIAAGQAAITREVAAYNTGDFASFGSPQLAAHWMFANLEVRDSYSPSAWFSTEDKPGNLLIQVLDDSAKPLAYSGYTHPTMLRPLPTTADWAMQTDVALDTRQTGLFFTGLYLEVVESGVTIRYAFGLENGSAMSVKRSSGGSFNPPLVSPTFNESGATLRVRRAGTQILFQRRSAGVWTTLRTQTVPAGSTATKGGVFVATDVAQNVRVAFDYFLLADPTNSSSVLGNLRITEVMYHPADPDTVEFIELQNTGAGAINLQGVHFENGRPFDEFVFGNINLAPGQFVVVTNSIANFQAKYGGTALLAGEWVGALSNGGERIVLLDVGGNAIHDFTYADTAPWPLSPDGLGPSLEVNNVNGDYNNGLNWHASWEPGGSPGWQGAGPDSDGDGQPDGWEAMFGTGPNDPASYYRAGSVLNGSGQPVLSWPSVAGRNYRVEYCDSLTPPNWQTLIVVSGTAGMTSYTDTTTPRPRQRFYKITAVP